MKPISIFWHRRDLRDFDNHGLFKALQGDFPVLPFFLFDREILDDLEDPDDARVTFLHRELTELEQTYQGLGSDIWVEYGYPLEVWERMLENFPVAAVYTNRDYEPYARDRDEKVRKLLEDHDIPFYTFKDHVVLEYDEVLKADGTPYTVFTPYSRRWKERIKESGIPSFPSEAHSDKLLQGSLAREMPSLSSMGFSKSQLEFPGDTVPRSRIRNYGEKRNFPATEGTSRLGIHFRFGTISIREKARNAMELSETYLNELIWRDFYSMILGHFPHVVGAPFKKAYEYIEWENNPEHFEAWCAGLTGYPLVDAGMRQLNATGYMHNRVRMLTASFLTKHLLIDWRWGEAYFARKLLDFDLASNNGGWQWAAGCGTDAAPYFRIFNPFTQQKKFDPKFEYIHTWIPEFDTPDYPDPIVDHKWARERCLETYKKGLDIGKKQ